MNTQSTDANGSSGGCGIVLSVEGVASMVGLCIRTDGI